MMLVFENNNKTIIPCALSEKTNSAHNNIGT